MSTATRVPLADVRTVADDLVAMLGLGCERIEIAGSIRRRRPDVGDIELVAVPRFEQEPDGLWDKRAYNVLTALVNTLILQGDLSEHPDDPKRGERYSKLLHRSGLQVDLFSARPETFGLIFLIRTGPASYSQRLVTDMKPRHHVKDGELHRGGSFGCPRDCEVIPTPAEQDVYAALGLSFVAPENRL